MLYRPSLPDKSLVLLPSSLKLMLLLYGGCGRAWRRVGLKSTDKLLQHGVCGNMRQDH